MHILDFFIKYFKDKDTLFVIVIYNILLIHSKRFSVFVIKRDMILHYTVNYVLHSPVCGTKLHQIVNCDYSILKFTKNS